MEASAFNNTAAQSGGKYNSNDQSTEVTGSVGERAAKGSPRKMAPPLGEPFAGRFSQAIGAKIPLIRENRIRGVCYLILLLCFILPGAFNNRSPGPQ